MTYDTYIQNLCAFRRETMAASRKKTTEKQLPLSIDILQLTKYFKLSQFLHLHRELHLRIILRKKYFLLDFFCTFSFHEVKCMRGKYAKTNMKWRFFFFLNKIAVVTFYHSHFEIRIYKHIYILYIYSYIILYSLVQIESVHAYAKMAGGRPTAQGLTLHIHTEHTFMIYINTKYNEQMYFNRMYILYLSYRIFFPDAVHKYTQMNIIQ